MFNPSMIGNPLEQIPDYFYVEESHRKLHKFYQEIGDQKYIYPGAKVQQYPSPYEIDRCPAKKQYKLSYKDKIDKAYILVVDTYVDDRLGEKRE